MATEEIEAPEGFNEVDSGPSGEDDPETVKLSPGESFQGTVLEQRDVGYNGLIVFKDLDDGEKRQFWHNGQTRSRFDEAEVDTGDDVMIANTGESRTYTDDDGTEQQYDVYKVYVR